MWDEILKKLRFFFRPWHQCSAGLMPPAIITEEQVQVTAEDRARARAQLFKEIPGSEGTGSGVHFKGLLAKNLRLTF